MDKQQTEQATETAPRLYVVEIGDYYGDHPQVWRGIRRRYTRQLLAYDYSEARGMVETRLQHYEAKHIPVDILRSGPRPIAHYQYTLEILSIRPARSEDASLQDLYVPIEGWETKDRSRPGYYDPCIK